MWLSISFDYLFSALTLFENNMMVCDVLLSSPEKTLNFFDLALLEAQSVIMETHQQKEDMVKLNFWSCLHHHHLVTLMRIIHVMVKVLSILSLVYVHVEIKKKPKTSELELRSFWAKWHVAFWQIQIPITSWWDFWEWYAVRVCHSRYIIACIL